MKIHINRRRAVSLAAAIIIMGGLAIIGGILVGGILKLSRKLNRPPPADQSTNTVASVTYQDEFNSVTTMAGNQVTLESLQLQSSNVRIMVQRWFPDRPEEFMYIVPLDEHQEFGIVDPTPDPVAGFYHVYIVTP